MDNRWIRYKKKGLTKKGLVWKLKWMDKSGWTKK